MSLPAFVSNPAQRPDRFVGMPPEERLRIFFELCELTESIVSKRPNTDRLREPTPRSEESLLLWQRVRKSAPLQGIDQTGV